MAKRNYDKYEEDVGARKHALNKNHLSSQKRNNVRENQPNTDLNYRLNEEEASNRKKTTVRRDGRRGDNDGNNERLEKIATLLGAIGDLVTLDSKSSSYTTGGFDGDVISQCKSLQEALTKQRLALSATSTSNTLRTPTLEKSGKGRAVKDLPHLPWKLSLTPWTSGSIPTTPPPLPPINSPDLENAAFTHSGMTSNAAAFSYERLEWVGDAYIYLISTLLISSTFTSHLPGKCSQIREILVKNETLASYARHYGFERRARLPSEFTHNNQSGFKPRAVEKRKVLGDIFEAYVAAVILSDPQDGVSHVSSWLKKLWAQTIAQQIKEQEQLNEKARTIPAGNANVNPKDILSRKIGAKNVKLTYKDAGLEEKDPATGFPLFTIGVYLDGWGEQDKQLGIGKALGKKEAGMRAAEMALANEDLMSSYVEQKQVHDERLRTEKEKSNIGVEESSHTDPAGK